VRLPLTICILFAASAAHSQVYKCTADGVTTYSQTPCSSSAEVVDVPSTAPRRKGDAWQAITIDDDMTGNRTCFAQSTGMAFFVGSDLVIANLRIGVINGKDLAVIYTPDGSGKPSLHNEIDGLGLKVEEHAFLPVSSKTDNLLVLNPLDSATAIEQLSAAKSFRVRVRFWPYKQTFDSAPSTTAGLSAALDEARRCK
jgi:hypothetical protein